MGARRRWSGAALGVTVALAVSVALGGSVSPGVAVASRVTTAADPLTASGVLVSPDAAPPPAVPATSWLVADALDGDVLASQNARMPLAPASALKVLTALALAPDLPDEALWTGSHDAAAAEGSKVGTTPGSVYSVADLMHGLLLGSGNDCAQALAELSGGMGAATERMQSVATELGATDTVARNTSGLDAPGQVSSARDLALLGRAALAEPRLATVMTTPRYAFPGAGTTLGPERPRFEVGNHNRLVGAYPGVLGLKNGFTNAARGSFVAAAERDGRRYVVTVIQAEGSTWRHAAALLDGAFAAPADLGAVGTLDAPDGDGEAEGVQLPGSDDPAARSRAAGDGAAPARDVSTADAEVAADGGGPPAPVLVFVSLLAVLAAAVVVLRARVLLLSRRP